MISIECNKGLPLDYEPFLIDRYESFIATCRYVEVYHPKCIIHHILVYSDDSLTELLLLGNNGNTALCFNSLVKFDSDVMEMCFKKIFEIYPDIHRIRIDASYTDCKLKNSVLFYKSDDYILSLPSSLDCYKAELGSKTRKHLKARNAKLLAEFSNVNFVTKVGVDIEEGIVDKIIQLNHDRMRHKGKRSGIDSIYKSNIYNYSQFYGCVIYLELDGVIVAGCIASIINKAIFLHVIAHDNNYSKYNVGEVCVFNLIQTSIDRGLSKLHFLWGFSELKRRMQAQPSDLFSYMVYRRYSLDYFICKMQVAFFEQMFRFKDVRLLRPLKVRMSTLRQRLKK